MLNGNKWGIETMAEANGTIIKSKEYYKRQVQELDQLFSQFLANASLIQERQEAFGNYGKQYENERNIVKAAGYKAVRIFDDYLSKYTFQPVAYRVVNAPVDATWREPPTLTDGAKTDTPFINTWNILVNFGKDTTTTEIHDQKSIWHYCDRVDRLAGIGRYGGLLLGVNDGSSYDQPLGQNATNNVEDFLYLAPYDEANLNIDTLGIDPATKRFNLPEKYTLVSSTETDVETENQIVDWTRIIHVAEGLKNNEVFGTERLEPVYNLLDDLLKVTAATGESAWQLMSRGIIATTQEGFKLPDNTDNIKEAMENFIHEQMRVLELQGLNVELTSGSIVDPTGVIKSIVSLISAATSIPQRLLLGSEAGFLASNQDEKAWAKKIEGRQTNFAEPVILRPLISRLIYVGILPPPTSGSYTVHWPSQLILNEVEKADVLQKEMSALASAVSPDLLPLVTFLKVELGWSDDVIKKMLENKALEQSAALLDFPAPAL